MASRVQQDSFIDDSEETCPLCVEEFDLSDRNFRPCPCGYQICQFCFHNIRSNMNGLCPACRRPYDDKSIEWKVVSPEEFKADLQKQQRAKAEKRRTEAQKQEAENSNRKHLAGMRVVQKNLVYVTGLNPRIKEEDLLQTLRGDQYFGQYGKIIKIVVSKGKDGGHGQQGIGVYVTFAKKEDATTCIAAVDGSQNGDRTLRAQYGTTKYCSAYLRNEQCMNKSCMFLHEPGEENDSFTRQDLSSMNVVSTQRPSQANIKDHQPSPMAVATQALARQASREPRHDDSESSALPTTASWATKGSQTQRSRRGSHAASGSSASPQVRPTAPVVIAKSESKKEKKSEAKLSSASSSAIRATPSPAPTDSSVDVNTALLQKLVAAVSNPQFKFVFSKAGISKEDFEAIGIIPPLFDSNGCARRRIHREREEAKRREIRKVLQSPDSALGLGSLQLAGEELSQGALHQHQHAAIGFSGLDSSRDPLNPSRQNTGAGQQFLGSALNGVDLLSQQRLVSKLGGAAQSSFMDQFPGQITGGPRFASPSLQQQQYQASLFQNQTPQIGGGQGQSQVQGHTRQASRYNFSGDNQSNNGVTSAKLANVQHLAQQHQLHLAANQAAQAYSGGGGLQGPPPGLKSAGTPPISAGGNGMLQMHNLAFANAGNALNRPGSGANGKVGGEPNPDVLQILRARGAQGGGAGSIGQMDSKRVSPLPVPPYLL